jgi:ribosomal-protein-alanine N-acetyltransferase
MSNIARIMFTLRLSTTGDFETVASWIPDAKACRLWAGPQLPFPFSPPDLPRLIAANETNTFSLSPENTGDLVGFGQWFDKGSGVARLARVIVSPSCRGHRLGRVLCQLLMREAMKTIAVELFTLGVHRDNAAAIATYSSLGFCVVEEKSTEDSLAMQLRANPAFSP